MTCVLSARKKSLFNLILIRFLKLDTYCKMVYVLINYTAAKAIVLCYPVWSMHLKINGLSVHYLCVQYNSIGTRDFEHPLINVYEPIKLAIFSIVIPGGGGAF